MKKALLLMLGVNAFNIANAQFTTFNNSGRHGSTTQPPNQITSIGIGDFRSPNVAPNARLHVNNFRLDQPNGTLNGFLFRTDGNSSVENRWQLFTGATATSTNEKFKLFVPANSLNIGLQASTGAMFFNTGGANERMRIFQGITAPSGSTNQTRVAIHDDPASPVTQPVSWLHIGANGSTGSGGIIGGQRNWMERGIFMGYASDNMFLGFKDESSGRYDAVINWGDNISSNTDGPDYLRFIFTQYTTNANDAGLEIARMTPNGNMGIGNFYNSTLFTFTRNPARRLEILSDKTSNSTHDPNNPTPTNGNAQLRLTNFQQNPANSFTIANTGKFAELHSVATGDLGIMARDNTQTNTAIRILKERFVGINTITPQNTLDINSQFVLFTNPNNAPAAPGFGLPTGQSGLRFNDLRSGSVPRANPGRGVLSVDGDGNVIYVPAISFASCAAPANLSNNSAVGLNGFHFNYTGIGNVGIGTACIPNNKLEIVSNAGNPYFAAGNASGLRLTNLTSSDAVIPNGINGVNTSKVLSVDGNGDVVLVQASTGTDKFVNAVTVNNPTGSPKSITLGFNDGSTITSNTFTDNTGSGGTGTVTADNGLTINPADNVQLGQANSNVSALNGGQLIRDTEIPLNNFNLLFTEPSASTGGNRIMIGSPLNAFDPSAKLHVRTIYDETAGKFQIDNPASTAYVEGVSVSVKNSSNNSTGINVDCRTTSADGGMGGSFLGGRFGIRAEAKNAENYATSPQNRIGVEGIATGAVSRGIGVAGSAVTVSGSTNQNVGLKGTASGAVENIGVLIEGIQGNATATNYACKFNLNSSSDVNFGIYSDVSGATAYNRAVYARAGNGTEAAGVDVQANGAANSFGVKSIARGITNTYGVHAVGESPGGTVSYGVYADGHGASTNYGIRALAFSGTTNYGIYASAPAGTGQPCPTPPCAPSGQNFAGYFVGDVVRTGGGDNFSSDAKLKENVNRIDNAIELIKEIQPKTFNYKSSEYPSMSLPTNKQYGMIAQEVEVILPELIKNVNHPATLDSAGNIIYAEVDYKTLDYKAFIPILLQGIKEQQSQIDSMQLINNNYQSQLDSIFAILNNLPVGLTGGAKTANHNSQALTIKNIELGGNTVVLEQNVPNPFAEQTTINYFIPDDVKFAQVIFYDNLGRIIKTVDITEKGGGQLNVFANNLGNGIYSYSLVVDGKVTDTKKMMRTK